MPNDDKKDKTITLQEHFLSLLAAADLRYGQRYDAQDKAVSAALVAQEKAVTAALTASDRAVERAEINSEKWRNNANEWRAAMDDREKNFMPRPESERETRAIAEKLDAFSKRLDLRDGHDAGVSLTKTSTVSNFQLLFGVIAVIGTLVGLWFAFHK